jgi:cyanate permease
MGSILGAWQLTFIVFAIPSGFILDRISPRTALTLGTLIIALSSLARAFSNDYWSMICAVMIFGIGGPIISAGAPKLITRWFDGPSRGLAMGIYMTGPAIGAIVSLTLTHSVLLPSLGSWQNIMLAIAGFSSVTGLFWFVIASSSQLQTTQIESIGPVKPKQTTVFLALIRLPAIRLLLLMSLGIFTVNHALNNWLPELLKLTGMSLIEAGYWAAIPTAIGILGSLTIPRLATPTRRFKILFCLCLCSAFSSYLLLFQSTSVLTTGLLLQGIVRYSIMTILILILIEIPGIDDKYAGIASGLFFTAAEIGGVFGPLGLGLLYDLTGNFQAGLIVLTSIAGLIAMATFWLDRLLKVKPPHFAP